jgi:hypothetical protein
VRWFLFLILLFAALWYLRGLEETPPPKAEDSFIGGPVKALRKAEGLEKSYLDAARARNEQMDKQVEEDSGND